MSDKTDFETELHAHLEWIDEHLAEIELPVRKRPFQAATIFADECITKVSTGDKEQSEPTGTLLEYAGSEWFKHIFTYVKRWYDARYGEALEKSDYRYSIGAVLLLGTPFVIHVPTTVRERLKPGDSFWLCYYDCVQDSENPLKWIKGGPNTESLPSKDAMKTIKLATEVASAIRAIHINLMTAEVSNKDFGDLRDGIIPYLESAAQKLAEAKPEVTKIALWDMQMACEKAMKALAQQRSAGFKETHDLFWLYDNMPEGPPDVARTELSKLPHWEKLVDLRYGKGDRVSQTEAFRTYRAVLKIVAACVIALERKLNLNGAKIQLQKPPWMDLSALTETDK